MSHDHSLSFFILGALECWADRRRVHLGGAIPERVLVTLLLEANYVVPLPRLVEAAWDDNPPATANHQIRKAVADLRRRLSAGDQLIATDGNGYRIAVDESQLDLHRFRNALERAKQAKAEGHSKEAIEALRAAVVLWRGPVMLGGGSSLIATASAQLEEQRLSVCEDLFELRLQQGEDADLISELRQLISANPFRENLRGHLLLALYRSGRQAEALIEYTRIRNLLAEELGVNPSPRLVRLHERILRDDPELVAPKHQRQPGDFASEPLEAPNTLPRALVDFTGREADLNQIVDLASTSGTGLGSTLVAIDGMGGAGKTSLALRAAHLLSRDYPDGQLYVNLQAGNRGEESRSPERTLGSLLRSLNIPESRIPDDVESQETLWRATLAGRRVLLVLDNAADISQVHPLLPSSPGCLTLVTSRRRLLDLDGANWVFIKEMSPTDSMNLLTRIIGDDRISAEPEPAATLVELCGHLPLALRLAGAKLRSRPRWKIQHLVTQLEDETSRLDELSSNERSVRATLASSYSVLEETHQEAFRILGLRPRTDLDVYRAAALLQAPVAKTEQVLEYLLDNHLLQQNETGLYHFHDLVGDFALRFRDEPEADGDEPDAFFTKITIERLLPYYLQASQRACETLFPARRQMDPADISMVDLEIPPLHDSDSVRRWFDREHADLVSTIFLCYETGHYQELIQLGRNTLFFLNLRAEYTEFGKIAQISVAAAQALDNPALLQLTLGNLAVAHWKIGAFREGIIAAREGLHLAQDINAPDGEAFCLSLLGLLSSALGDLPEARKYLHAALLSHGRTRYSRQQAETLGNLSSISSWTGDFVEAMNHAEQALHINRELSIRDNEVSALADLAVAHLGLNEIGDALQSLQEALHLTEQSSPPENTALVFALAANAWHRKGSAERASSYADKALELVRTKGTALRRSTVENLIGLLHRERLQFAQALHLHESAYRHALSIDYKIEMARALHGIAKSRQALGDTAMAHLHQMNANILFESMQVPAHCRV